MLVSLPTIAELRNLQFASSALLGVAGVAWGVSYAVSSGLERLTNRRQAAEEQAERRRFQAVMPARDLR